VLHIHRISDQTGAYYLADLATELAPLRAGEERLRAGEGRLRAAGSTLDLAARRPGWWTGAAASSLGLAGPVDPEDLTSVLGGQLPVGHRVRAARADQVAAYDLTFTAPKSVSVLFGVGTSEMSRVVAEAHAASVEAAMGYVERRAMAARRGSGETRRTVPVSGAVAAAFTHGVSRAQDPHLHTHVIVANMVHGEDGRWSAIDGRGIFAHARASGAVYAAELRHRMAGELGVEFVARKAGFEVAGIGPEVVAAFSTRSAEIRTNLAEASWSTVRRHPNSRDPSHAGTVKPGSLEPWAIAPSRRAHHVAWVSGRDAKAVSLDPVALAHRWGAIAASMGFDLHDLDRTIGRSSPGSPQAVDEHRFAARIVTSPHATVRRRDVVEAWATAVHCGISAGDVERCVDAVTHWDDPAGAREAMHAPASVVPAPWKLKAFGPRPACPDLIESWIEGVAVVAAYRTRWGVVDRDHPLGVESASSLSSAPAARLADHLMAERHTAEVRRTLDRALQREPVLSDLVLER